MKRLLASVTRVLLGFKRVLTGLAARGKRDKARRPGSRPERRARLGIEWMEDRFPPSTAFLVNAVAAAAAAAWPWAHPG
jgi:hypothetical protein